MNQIADVVTYPAVVVGVIASYIALGSAMPATIASYLAVSIGAVAIIGLEQFRPYRPSWKPHRRAVINDATFLTLVQMVLPTMLTLPIAIWVSGQTASMGIQNVWPHDQNIVLQVVLMLVIGDFFRYWMHRAAHASTRLWQFHAVHHSPKNLYWLNVGRFHPLEKIVQLLADSLPFVLLAVDRRVLAGYFVFYAINGFFQHSNCRVQLKGLNYIFAGPELHRWHHSRLIDQSDRNFGNNLIIWDTLFGTRYLPAGSEVGDLGLLNRSYPDGFVAQLTTPFHVGLEKANHDNNPTSVSAGRNANDKVASQ